MIAKGQNILLTSIKYSLQFFSQSNLENTVKLMKNSGMAPLLFTFLTYQCCCYIILAAIMKKRTRTFSTELFNIVARNHMWQLKFKYKLKLSNIKIQFLCCSKHILNVQ